MIDWISISHFAIGAAVELELEEGFSAVTGETGSGKSMMVDALSVLLGARADNSLIQHGQEQAEIQCSFHLNEKHPVYAWLDHEELLSDDELILRRVIRRDKPSRGFINGKSVNVSMLRELGQELVDIHGQHEHHSLLRRSVQQELLDDVAGLKSRLAELSQCYRDLSDAKNQLQRVNDEEALTDERIDLLKFQLLELDQLTPIEGEWETLEQQHKRLNHHQELASGCQIILSALYEQDEQSVHETLTRLSGQLKQLEKFDHSLSAVTVMLEESAVVVEEAARHLQNQSANGDLDQVQMAEIERRFSSFHELSRKHRVQPSELAAHTETLRNELNILGNPGEERDRLEKLIEKHQEIYNKISARVTKTRTSAAKKLSKQITSSMQDLGMQGGAFAIELKPIPEGQISRIGNENIEFMVTANSGVPLQPLARVASGGELSRISLAIQVILAGTTHVPTLIFDEVDVGIGGTIANVVGKHLRELGKSNQVICVTHLAQVAARADHHISVLKEDIGTKNGGVNIAVTMLDQEQRIAEIARMSGSEMLTPESRAHAEQMLSSGLQ